MDDIGDVGVFGMVIIEGALESGITEYKETQDFEEFKKPLVASLSPARIRILKMACEELTTSRKDYHIVMSFIDTLEKISEEVTEEVIEEMEE